MSGGERERLALVMVGLPARGKTYVTSKIARYLAWLGYDVRAFNVGDYRRARAGAGQPAAFFDPANEEGVRARLGFAMAALDDLLAWMRDGGEVAIYDATNSERSRRALVAERCAQAGVQVVFVESVCEDATVIEANVRETKLRSPDYAGTDPDLAALDFRQRIANYEKIYEPLGEHDEDASYVKLVDVGRQVVVNRMEGYLASRLIFFLMNIHPARRRIYLTRHGESQFNTEGRIGGDPPLSPRGERYALELSRFIAARSEPGLELVLLTSTLQRTLQTARHLDPHPSSWRALDEIDAGVCDGLTYEEIEARFPDEFAARARDKLAYRYPRGESYADVIQRLEPVIVEIERLREPILIIAHQAVLRALYVYLAGRPQGECPHTPIPLHTVIELTPTAYGYDEVRHTIPT